MYREVNYQSTRRFYNIIQRHCCPLKSRLLLCVPCSASSPSSLHSVVILGRICNRQEAQPSLAINSITFEGNYAYFLAPFFRLLMPPGGEPQEASTLLGGNVAPPLLSFEDFKLNPSNSTQE